MSAMSEGLRWFGALLADTADLLEVPSPEPAPRESGHPEVDEELRRMRERIQGRHLY
jgi:hypothetical protein